MTPSRARNLLLRSARLAAALLVLVACIWVARWFAHDAVRLPEASRASLSESATKADEPSAERLRRPAAPPSAESLIRALENFAASNCASTSAPASGLFDSLAAGAAADPGVPLPDGVTRLYAQGGRDGSDDLLAVYRTAGSMSAVAATVEQRMTDAGWRREARTVGEAPPRSAADSAPTRWFARYVRGDRMCLMMVAPDARRDESLLVVRTLRTALESP